MIKEVNNIRSSEPLSKYLEEGVKEFNIQEGIVLIKAFSKESSIISSNIEQEKSLYDLNRSLEKVVPSKLENISNSDPKYLSSLSKSAIVGKYHTVVIEDGKLLLGKRQEIYLYNYSDKTDKVLLAYY